MFYASLITHHGLEHVPGKFPTRNSAHAAARRIAHKRRLRDFETLVAPAPSTGETVAVFTMAVAMAAERDAATSIPYRPFFPPTGARKAAALHGLDSFRHGCRA